MCGLRTHPNPQYGVRVEPIVNVTKLGLTFFAALGGMFLAFKRARQASRG